MRGLDPRNVVAPGPAGDVFLDRSGLIVQVSPRSIDVKKRFPPACTTSGLCGERMKGVFQFQRISVPCAGMGTMFDEGLFSLARAAGC